MAPKRRGSIVGAPVARRKRTVRRPARQASPSSDSASTASTPSAVPGPSSPVDVPGSSSPHIDPLAGRVITMGRKVDFGFFEDEGFTIGKQLKDMGWEMICSLDLPTYPSLVKDFYMNLSRGDGGIVSSVRGTRIHLTSETLGSLLDIPVTGMIANVHSDRGAALTRFLGRDVAEFEEVRANQLPLELRLLHNICSRILFPKTGRFEYVSERDIVVMDSVITGQPINLPGMIIWYMAEAGSKKRATLPYGMILTKVFQSQGVSILDNEPMKTLRHTDYYSKATLHRMGFIKVNGNWERKGSTDDRAADMETGVHGTSEAGPSVRHMSPGPSCPAPPVPTPAPSASAQSSTGFTDTQMEQLRSLLSVYKEDLKMEFDERITGLKELFLSLKEKVNKIESSLGSSSEALKSDLMQIFDKIKDIGGDSDAYSKSNAELQEKISVASEFIDKRLNDFIKIQSEGMGEILEELKRLIRF